MSVLHKSTNGKRQIFAEKGRWRQPIDCLFAGLAELNRDMLS